jgi:hypothetical protein
MTVYEIAVGVFLALTVRDIISLVAAGLVKYLENKKYERELDEFMENLDAELQEIRKTEKKKKKKTS